MLTNGSIYYSMKQKGVDADMDKELIAHGYSNAISGIFAGLQNYLCYANSVLYAECEGHGIFSSFLIVMLTLLLYFIGPTIGNLCVFYLMSIEFIYLLCHFLNFFLSYFLHYFHFSYVSSTSNGRDSSTSHWSRSFS